MRDRMRRRLADGHGSARCGDGAHMVGSRHVLCQRRFGRNRLYGVRRSGGGRRLFAARFYGGRRSDAAARLRCAEPAARRMDFKDSHPRKQKRMRHIDRQRARCAFGIRRGARVPNAARSAGSERLVQTNWQSANRNAERGAEPDDERLFAGADDVRADSGAHGTISAGWRIRIPRSIAGYAAGDLLRSGTRARASAALRRAPVRIRRCAALVARALSGRAHGHSR